ncbi:Uncharacterized protein HKD37_01G002534 [Glycine soja]|nr:hypothetical protein D0Y65_002094 [Glycine soja]
MKIQGSKINWLERAGDAAAGEDPRPVFGGCDVNLRSLVFAESEELRLDHIYYLILGLNFNSLYSLALSLHASHVFCLLLTLLSSLPNRRSAITVATHGETRPPRPTFPPHPSTKFPASVREEANLVICCVFEMGEIWWSLLGAAIPVVVAGQAFRVKKRRAEEQRLQSARGRERSSDEIFVCERVCTSKRMLKKVGSFSKDPIPDTCVTVCGVSDLDACADACARTVCINQHQVPNWNDICLRRCQSECLKLSSQSQSS